MPTTTDLIAQLNALLRLTNTEVMVAETRRAQAATPDIERELDANADKGRERAELLATAIRDLGGAPDVLGVAAGRVAASAKATIEQGQDVIDALLGDLALEHELFDRTRLAAMIADSIGARPARRVLDRLERAHTATIDWLMTRLAEVAVGGPVALRPTPLQSAVGFGRRLTAMPAVTVSGTMNRSIENAARARQRAAEAARVNTARVRELVEAAGDIWTAGRDASLKRTEEIAEERGNGERARAVGRRRRELGAVDESELPIRRYDSLRADEAISRIDRLSDIDDARAILAYENAHKARKGVLRAANDRVEQLAARMAAAS